MGDFAYDVDSVETYKAEVLLEHQASWQKGTKDTDKSINVYMKSLSSHSLSYMSVELFVV